MTSPFSLVEHLEGFSFVEILDHVASLAGFMPTEPVWTRPARESEPAASIPERWRNRRKPWRGSATWRYLRDERSLPESIIRSVIEHDLLREGPCGSMWAAHRSNDAVVTGWEERGPEWRGFSSGGAKLLFRFGPPEALRLCLTEAATDAMSLAALEEGRPDSLYLSTGGGWSPATEATIRILAMRDGTELVAATDNNEQGDRYAERLEAVAAESACTFKRLRPVEDDWNAELKARAGKGEKGTRLPHARRPRQG